MSVRPSVGWSVGRSVTLELKSGKTRISAPIHPFATDGRVSGLVTFSEASLRKFLPHIFRTDDAYAGLPSFGISARVNAAKVRW